MQAITIIMSVTASVISGMALFFLQRYFKRRDKKDEDKDRAKARESVLILKSINAVGKLTVANSIALRDGKSNGAMHSALDDYEKIDTEMYDYLLEQNAKNK